MTRNTLKSAIKMGLSRSSGKPLDGQIDSVLMAIELAMEMSGDSPPVPAEVIPKSPGSDFLPPPPSPESVVEASVIEVKPNVKEPEAPPPPVDNTPKLVVSASMRDIDSEVPKRKDVKVRSVFLGGSKKRVKMMDVAQWCSQQFPATISVIPRDVDKEISLNRNIHSYPCSGESVGKETESIIKLIYKHPKMDQTMEVGVPIRVGDIEEKGWPDTQAIMAKIYDQAREMYRAREKYIEGAAPTSPPMDQSFRIAVNGIQNKGVAQERGSITFGEADDAKEIQQFVKR